MALFLGMALLAHLPGLLHAVPTLEGPAKITGPWKGNLKINCTYQPMEGYTQVLVKWLIQQDSNPETTIFLRDLSGDHIQQAKYRGRIQVSREAPGDVSLELDTLEMDDRGRYLCQVTWKIPDGELKVTERTTELQIKKLPASKPVVTTGSGYGFKVPQGMRISLLCQAKGSPPITYKWYKGEPDGTPTQVATLGTLLFKPAVLSDSGSYFCIAKARVGPEQFSDVVQFVVTDPSKRPTTELQPGTLTIRTTPLEATHRATAEPSPRQPTTAGADHAGGSPKGPVMHSGSPSLAPRGRLTISPTFTGPDHAYEVARMSTGDVPRVSIYSGVPAETASEARAPENEYQDEHTSNQDYHIITQANSDYARLLCGSSSAEYEIQENGKTSC
ncbi:V-set and immunoglobulin domain-containing protein 4 isoform X2 [Monodelphis domestica]|uniref:V-set and immunoglobulin domain-containing protein 4 isoform X2 n=1 Tax=Monodelphis domestica TaxID=13616 RepID=UPI0024E1DA0F|nr:V-set and immunoglobulin domain-containing protein 4 isoform X2 [Monodelphis domestica]